MFIRGTSGVSSHPKLHTYEEGYLLPVLNHDALLFGQRHKGLLRQIFDLAELSQDDFDATYGILIKNFMEYVQVLPQKMGGVMGSLLNYSLARAIAVFQKYCALRKRQAMPLLKFAVFSAALLKDVGCVMTNQRIVLTDDNGEFISDWNPLSGSMIGQSKFYKMYPITAVYLRIEAEVTPLIARQIIPRDIFLWLSSDLAIFADWLAALLNQEGVGSKEITWILMLIKRDDIMAIFNTMDGATIEATLPAATEYAEAFLKWLKAAIEKGELPINTDAAGLHIVAEGLLIENKIFKQFVDICNMPVKFQVVYAQFGNLMGIVKKSGSDFFHAAYFSPSDAATSCSSFASNMSQPGRVAREGMVVDVKMILTSDRDAGVSNLRSTKAMTSAEQQKPLQAESLSIKLDTDFNAHG